MVSKYALHSALSLLKLKSEFHNSKLESMQKDTEKHILHLEGLLIWMNKFGQKGSRTDKDFIIYISNTLPNDYDVILNGLENCLKATRNSTLTIDVICNALNHQYKKIKSKKKKNQRKDLRSL